MKLTGEYEITETGVVIEGHIHDTHIAEVRDRFRRRSVWLVGMYPGSPLDMERAGILADSRLYKMLGPTWFESMQNRGYLSNHEMAKMLGIETDTSGYSSVLFNEAGILCSPAASHLMRFQNRRGSRTVLKLLNVGWIYDAVQGDGSFRVELYGLVNRHIMTMMLQRATRYAKLLDSPKVWDLSGVATNLSRVEY